ncbi:hypothetical protein BofuT4_uP110600.1 [Botrytis cinerea T4]|uniref:Uncharacterized protein n=1 Tax=Botryotinia fuckeliana (strain T4) TaxID=999810 RepID=G2Y5Z5_BOTF4|nr:hypothetical protein BofuT4_uP110600.1 [Botrytis cinerea T4]
MTATVLYGAWKYTLFCPATIIFDSRWEMIPRKEFSGTRSPSEAVSKKRNEERGVYGLPK